MILRALPPEVLAADISQFEANGSAATEIGLPMQMILGQLPSGKVEMTLQELIPHFPPGYLQPTESLTNYLATPVLLPLMDVVMRIPPDLLALRPDQKDVDSAVINMADPFTEEILRDQAEAARRQQAQTNIIEESQAPHEEFVPRDQGVKTVAPPRRPYADALIPARTTQPTPAISVSPLPQAPKLPSMPQSGSLRAGNIPPPTIPSSTLRPPPPVIQPPTRATTTLPNRPTLPPQYEAAPEPEPVVSTPEAYEPPPLMAPTAPIPPNPRHTGPIPAPPPPRHTTALPTFARTTPIPELQQEPESQPESAPEPVPSAPADPNADDLQRLAALAMEQLDDQPDGASEASGVTEAPTPIHSQMASTVPIHSATTPIEQPVVQQPVFATVPIPAPAPVAAPVAAAPEPAAPEVVDTQVPAAEAPVAFNLNTCTAADLVQNIPGCSQTLAHSIIEHRTKIGSFKSVEELLNVPGMTKITYTDLTGEAPPANRIALTLNELLGFSVEQQVTLKDVTDRIACWPDVTGCVLSQNSGLSLVGTVPPGIDKAAIVAFAPRMFDTLNKSFSEVAGKETDALLIPTPEISFSLFRRNDLYLIIMSRLPQMPERHMKVARLVIAELSERKD
jgi:DNA uptake protein ComE-like DNA-binding protein